MSTQDWTKDDFLCFLMIYAAAADHNISPDEAAVMEKKAGAERFAKMLQAYYAHTAEESEGLIREFKATNYPTMADFQPAVKALMDLYMSDGNYSEEEAAQISTIVAKF